MGWINGLAKDCGTSVMGVLGRIRRSTQISGRLLGIVNEDSATRDGVFFREKKFPICEIVLSSIMGTDIV